MFRKLFSFCLMCCLAMPLLAAKAKFTLVIDAGHGGKDAGACTRTAKEKDINLSVALAFGHYVERNCPDVRVIYTRKTDVFVPLHERASMANRNKADVFISIHTNSVASKKPISGMETYTMGMRRSDEKLSAAMRENEVISYESDYKQHYSGYDPKSPESTLIFQVMNENNMAESVELASLIQRYTCSTAGRPNKGVRQDAFLVLRETSMPACLVELGYITTPAEERYLTNKNNVDLMGRGIYQAFVAYKNKRTGKSAATVPMAPVKAKTVEEPQTQQQEKVQEKPDTMPQKAAPDVVEQKVAEDTVTTEPVFKVQFMASDKKLQPTDPQMKGLEGVDCYKEGALWKYTVGASTNYNDIYNLRKTVLEKFPQAFIVAFRGQEKIDTQAAYQEYKQNKNKK